MKIAMAIKRLTLLLVPRQERLALSDGYTVLVGLGWPISIITKKMCDRAEAGGMHRYAGVQSWIAYKEEWEWPASTNLEGGKMALQKSAEAEPADVVDLDTADHRQTL